MRKTNKEIRMKTLTKLRKADSLKKTEIWQALDMNRQDAENLVKEMIMSVPGYYKIHSREYGTNLIDTIYETYGWMPSMLISERLLLGMQVMNPKKVYASFTLGLDAIEIRK